MTDNNKNNLSVIDGPSTPSVRDSSVPNSISENLMEDVRVATWELSVDGTRSTWSPARPAWLPKKAVRSLKSFLEHIHSDDRKYFARALADTSHESFETQLRLQGPAGDIWVHVNGRRNLDSDTDVMLVIRDASAVKSLQLTLQNQIQLNQEMVRDTEALAFEVELPSWSIRHIDRQVEAVFGYPAADWLRRKTFLRNAVLADDWHKFEQIELQDIDDNHRFSFEFRIKNANGEIHWVRCAGRQIPVGPHSPARARGVFLDVSESHIAIEARDVSERQLNMLYDQNPSIFFSMDTSGLILSVNRYGAEHLGYRREELISRNIEDIHHPSQRGAVHEYFQECVAAEGEVNHWETCLIRNDDSPLWVRVAARAVVQGTQRGILAVCEDITEARALSDKLEYQSRFDLLTGLANRSSFEHSLKDALATSKEHLWEHVLCYLDLDQFKIVNDTCGHSAGDQILRRVGRMLSRYLREEDVLARLGGDEFGILFYRCDLANARRRAEQINQHLASQRFKWKDYNNRITSSVGIVAINDRSESTETLLRIADTACYAAKDAGRNRVYCYAEDDDVEITRRHGEMSWIARLQAALDHDGFQIYSQVILPLDSASKRPLAIEILVRLDDDDGDVVLPERFIRAAENYHIATRIDSWVCTEVIDFFERRSDYLEALDFVCVNLSAQSVTDLEFQHHLVGLLENRQHIASRLCFEITETGVIENLEAATEFIRSLKALGCRFALDDFGSGVSSFAYLKNLEVDIVKIDGMFVKHMIADPIDQALVSSINDIGHAMGILTIAEFVEDEETKQRLQELGVDFAQGFHIHKPQLLKRHLEDSLD